MAGDSPDARTPAVVSMWSNPVTLVDTAPNEAIPLSWALDLTAVEGRKQLAVGINPQNEMDMCIGYPGAEHRRHKDDAVADHSHVWPDAGPVVDRVAQVTHGVRQSCKFIAVGPCVNHGPGCPRPA
jgi:hypothetical protein